MRTPTPADIKKAKRRIDNNLEAGMRRAKRRKQSALEKEELKAQRAKYASGAAESPTLPPRASLDRDEKTLQILSIVEDEATDSGGYVLVDALAQKFLNEQNLINIKLATVPLTSFDDLLVQITRLASSPDPKKKKVLKRRLKLREKLTRQKVRVYGWDKCTHLLRSCFISWAMNPQSIVPFTVNLSDKAIDGAKLAKTGFATHLQDRLRSTLKRRLGGHAPDFWFAVERGSKFGFHLHGAIACGTDAKIQAQTKAALQSFSGLKSSKAVELSAAGPRLRWSEYSLKHSVTTQKLINGDNFSCTLGCRRQGKAMYEAFRSEVRQWMKA
ncbi:hypothetical protein [Henriciella mobilis]|nr:hypothetical protein [Henriciella mobilis]